MNALNVGALVIALAVALIAVAGVGREAKTGELGYQGSASGIAVERDAAGVITQVIDHHGQRVAVGNYRRIVSLGLVSDAALLSVCEPDRVVGWSAFTSGPRADRLPAGARLRGLDDLEAILVLKSDLVIVSTYGGEADRLARLRAAGLRVFCLGSMSGLEAYTQDLERVGALIGHGDTATAEAERLRWRLANVCGSLATGAERPTAVYVGLIGDNLFGGAVGTSYHEVIIAGGCRDAASEAGFKGWPQYSVEQLAMLRPQVLLTKVGMGQRLARMASLGQVRLVELPEWMLEDPGPPVLDAAERLFQQVHGKNTVPVARP